MSLFVVEVIKVKHGCVLRRDLELTIRTLPSLQFGREKPLPTWNEVGLLETSLTILGVLRLVEV